MARNDMKVDKSFKRQTFVEVANIVNGRFPTTSMDAYNVKNHIRTLKQKYQEIKKLMNLSGVSWNDTEKMLVLEDETYQTYGQPKAKEYLNKPIPFFEELQLVDGDDHTTGDQAHSIYQHFGGTNEEDENPPTPDVPMEHEPLETNLGELAASIKENKKKTWKEKLLDALWSMEAYSDADMDVVFEKFHVNKDLAEAFYLRKPSLRKLWLDNFIASMRDSRI
ncbi:uncharacterized protein LOC120278613 [Dioscorea cayenensis subsp. rotundata]|uniref:Uncharacterized protein LOC120278613 n=1 Tax=Dioscorea cayennensis subsp. rotundata TaxID=55577 RepID=A0AB40CMU3_DIOCR|nr:uncharacterized protein LOC120278613 [Dioscorea cayenensis subsp. rotundata]